MSLPEKINRRRFLRKIRKHPVVVCVAVIWTLLSAMSVVPLLLPPEKAQKFTLYPYLPKWDWHIVVVGFLGIFLLVLLESYYDFYRKKVSELQRVEEELREQTIVARNNAALNLRRSTEVIGLQQRLRVVEGELEPKNRELRDAYATIERLQPFKDEVDSLRKSVEDKERELATLTPSEKESRLRLQAQGITHIAYDHNLSSYKHSYDGTGHGFTIVIQVINLAVRGVPAKAVRVRAQAVYRTEGQGEFVAYSPRVDRFQNQRCCYRTGRNKRTRNCAER